MKNYSSGSFIAVLFCHLSILICRDDMPGSVKSSSRPADAYELEVQRPHDTNNNDQRASKRILEKVTEYNKLPVSTYYYKTKIGSPFFVDVFYRIVDMFT